MRSTERLPLKSPPLLCLLLLRLVGPLAVCGQTPLDVTTIKVPGTSNPYLAGMPPGTTARFNDTAPQQSPVLVERSLANAVSVGFQASGAVEHGPFNPPQYDPPNGSVLTTHQRGAEHGISDITAPMDSLVAVFLGDDRPDRLSAPKPLKWRSAGRDVLTLSPQLKQIFFIGDGRTKAGANRRFLVPKGATRLFLGVMDGFEWSNNSGSFVVAVSIERTDVSSNMFSVDSHITFADWTCLPDRSQCTPERPVIREISSGQYHVILPAHMEWGASIPTPSGRTATVFGASGTVCLDSQSRSTSSCNGPQGNGTAAGDGFLVRDKGIGALVSKTSSNLTYFSVNDRSGATFERHEGYFEFDVTIK